MMIIPPNTADVMQNPIKTPTWKINESRVAYLLKHTMFDYNVPSTVIIVWIKTEDQVHQQVNES